MRVSSTLRRNFILFAAALLALWAVIPASAGKTWCRTDPILIVDGQVVDIQVASDLSMLTSANGPIQMVVTVPADSNANVVLQDLGFGRGYEITINYSDALEDTVVAEVAIYAPADDGALPVTVYGTRLSLLFPLLNLWTGEASGSANEWITLEIH